jgi:hypothetical protein
MIIDVGDLDQIIETVLATMSLQQFFLLTALAMEKRELGSIADHCSRIAAQIARNEKNETKKRKPRRVRS